MAEIKLYQFGPIADRESASPFCVKLHYALRYKRLPFETVNLPTPNQVKKYNPRGKLPVLGYEGRLMIDSSEIVRHLEQQHPEPRLYPEDQRERAHALLLEDWADESLYWHVVYENWLIDDQFEKFAAEILAPIPALLRPIIKIVARRQTRASLVGQGLGRLNPEEHRELLFTSLDWLDSIVDGAFLCGKELSIADVSVAAQVACLVGPLTPVVAPEVRKRSRLVAWFDRVKAAVA